MFQQYSHHQFVSQEFYYHPNSVDIPVSVYQLSWGDNRTPEIQTNDENIAKTLTFNHKYNGPNLTAGSNGVYTAILQGFRRDESGKLISCGSASATVTISNGKEDEQVNCDFTGDIKADPEKVNVDKDVSFTAKNIKKGEGATEVPNFWRYSFGDGETKPFDGTIKELNEQGIKHPYKYNGTYSVVLRGYWYGNKGSSSCGTIATTVEVVNGEPLPGSNCSIGDLAVTPQPGKQNEDVTAKITNMNNVDSLVIDWGNGYNTNTPAGSNKGETNYSEKYKYASNNVNYTITATGYRPDLTKLCGSQSKPVCIGECPTSGKFNINMTVDPPNGGTAIAKPDKVDSMGSAILTASPNNGFEFGWFVCNGNNSPLNTNPYTAINITGNVDCIAKFSAVTGNKKYGCSNNQCVETLDGSFTESTCGDTCVSVPVIKGVCGPGANQNYKNRTDLENAGLCSSGAPTVIRTETNGYDLPTGFAWECQDTEGTNVLGTLVPCSANKILDAKCGNTAGKTFANGDELLASYDALGGACDNSIHSTERDLREGRWDWVPADNKWKWSCRGLNGGKEIVDCGAFKQ